MNDNPTGDQMFKRTERIKDMVKQILIDYPQTRGDDTLLYITLLRKYYWRIVKVNTRNGGLVIDYGQFGNVFYTPSHETARRRRQEIQSEERHKLERGEITHSDLLPSIRVIKKRIRNENAYRHYHGTGQIAISDYCGD